MFFESNPKWSWPFSFHTVNFQTDHLSLKTLYHTFANQSRRSLVYHQFLRNCISSATCCGISSTRSVVSHQAAGGFMHGYAVMIYHRKAMDDIQPRWGWWYAKPAAWIKKEVTFGRQKLLLFLEQGTGVEPAFTAWEAVVLPIYEPCMAPL